MDPKVFVLAEPRSGSKLFQQILETYLIPDLPFPTLFDYPGLPQIEISPDTLHQHHFNMHAHQIIIIEQFWQTKYERSFIQDVLETTPDRKWFHTLRENKLKQAISLLHANETDIFHTTEETQDPCIELPKAKIDECLKYIGYETAGMHKICTENEIYPFKIFYEGSLETEDQWETLIENCAEYLGVTEIPSIGPYTKLKKTTNATQMEAYQTRLSEHYKETRGLLHEYLDT